VEGTLRYEQARGLIDLVHRQVDRIRLLVAVDEEHYRPDLMTLPQIDAELINDLYHRYVIAASDFNAWANQYLAIYAEMDRDLVFAGDIADEEGQKLFESLFKVAGPINAFPNIDTEEKREALKITTPQPAPQNVEAVLNGIIATRRGVLSSTDSLPRPYAQYESNLPEEPDDLVLVEPSLSTDFDNPAGQRSPGLYRLQTDYKNQISAIEDNLEENFELLDEINDFLAVQRQQLDSISVSFAALAGGVQGDGSGLNLMRWTTGAKFLPVAQEVVEE